MTAVLILLTTWLGFVAVLAVAIAAVWVYEHLTGRVFDPLGAPADRMTDRQRLLPSFDDAVAEIRRLPSAPNPRRLA